MAVSTLLSIFLRWWRHRGILSLPFGFAYVFMVLSYIVSFMTYSFLANAGKSTRDAAGNLKPPSVDLSNPGMICEWIFDVLYITCKRSAHAYAITTYCFGRRGVSDWQCASWRICLVVIYRGVSHQFFDMTRLL